MGAKMPKKAAAKKSPAKKRIAKKKSAKSAKIARPRKAVSKESDEASASREIDAMIKALGDWRSDVLDRVRRLIKQAVPEVVEEVKWRKPSNSMRGVPVWSHDGILCTGEIYTKVVKLTFAKGASLPDPSRLFNASLEGNTRRAIDIAEGETVDAAAFKALVKAAVAKNHPTAKKR
jgi:hypothetical protein